MFNHDLPIRGFGYCNLSVVALRPEPSHRTEMISQLLFGETFTIIDRHRSWLRIICSFDNYAGWIESNQAKELTKEAFVALSHATIACSTDLIQVIYDTSGNRIFPVFIGSSLPGMSDGKLTIGSDQYEFEGNFIFPPQKVMPSDIIRNAYLFLNCPYLWGGRSPFGIDCSGLVQIAYKMAGIPLLRDSHLQASQGEVVNLLSEARPGDIVFFDNDEGQIVHAGILIDQNTIIHASGHVRTDLIDHFGIFDKDTRKYTHRSRLIKRII